MFKQLSSNLSVNIDELDGHLPFIVSGFLIFYQSSIYPVND
ncbi:hypothetical protein WAK64_15830 [Bacillus spongiae]|uniref:Uncharacterized protein n=1 Tax=Bacillus spongiae TaxID=2683610 RepID=A0ABU8HH77_9BACI